MLSLELMDEAAEVSYLSRLRLQTENLIAKHRPAIEALAGELSWAKTVMGNRVGEIVAQNPNVSRPKSAGALAVALRAAESAPGRGARLAIAERMRHPKTEQDWTTVFTEIFYNSVR